MANQYGTYVQGNLFRGNYKRPGGTMHTPRTGYSKAANIGYDAAYYGGLAYGLYQGRETLEQQQGLLAVASLVWPGGLRRWLPKP